MRRRADSSGLSRGALRAAYHRRGVFANAHALDLHRGGSCHGLHRGRSCNGYRLRLGGDIATLVRRADALGALGAATAALGEKAAFACTAAVEEVIDEHYAAQIERLGADVMWVLRNAL